MKTKEIHVGVTLPYQLSQYMFGRVEFSELVAIEEGDAVEEIRKSLAGKLLKQAKEQAVLIVHGADAESVLNREEERKEPLPRRRRQI